MSQLQEVINELTAQRNWFADQLAVAKAETSLLKRRLAELEKKLAAVPKIELHDLPANPYEAEGAANGASH